MTQVSWEISAAEWQANQVQFGALNPVTGKIDGNSARSVLMKSNLPAQTLARIWQLSDLDRDGMLNIKEFSIAMRLTRNCLAGSPLPAQLPPTLANCGPVDSMVTPAVPMGSSMPIFSEAGTMNSMSSMPPYGSSPMNTSHAAGFPVYNTAPVDIGRRPPPPMPSGSPGYPLAPANQSPSKFPGRESENWTIPHQTKLKYCQQFNQLDKQRSGYLTGQASRGAMGLSGLPTPALAHIWTLSDVNKDGRLSVDEFCIAMHMIDMHKNGYSLPNQTPPELAQMCGMGRSANNSPQLEPGAPPAQKSPAPKTFEDKRQDNFAKGQAELERRRQILMEEENRRRAEEQRKEREEFDKRERERLEKERRREEERRQEMERLRMLEEARMEEERKRAEAREAARKEAEKQRLVELEKQRAKDMQTQKQAEIEKTAQRQQRSKTLQFQLQALDEKASDTDSQITQAREKIQCVTSEIETMRGERDEKLRKLQELANANQQISVQSQELAHQLLQMQGQNKETTSRKTELERLRERRDAVRSSLESAHAQLKETGERSAAQLAEAEKKKSENAAVRADLLKARDEYRKLLSNLSELQIRGRTKLAESDAVVARQLEEERRKAYEEQQRRNEELAAQQAAAQAAQVAPTATAAAFTSNDPFGPPAHESHSHHNGVSGNTLPTVATASTVTSKYRAIYEFEARTTDEISFQPGDVILVFEGYGGEPGWRAGQIRDKVGWFPEAFAELIAPVSNAAVQPIQNMPPNVTPSPSLDRIPEEGISATQTPPRVASSSSSTTLSVISRCVAQFPWKARNDGDLSFMKGDIIEVVEQQDMKWRGRKADGSIGWFPKSYVKVQSGSKTPSVSGSVDPPTPTATTPGNSMDLGSRQNTVPGQVSQSQSQAFTTQQQPEGEWFLAVYDFEATESTDLPLVVGDHILVLEQNDAWWKGRSNGREGIFPANYVQKMTSVPQSASGTLASPAILCRVRAISTFEGSAQNQLSLRVGDEVSVREKSDAGWWEGEVLRDGERLQGWFPGDYVVSIEGEATPTANEVTATALFDYDASQPDELSFKTGDIVVVDTKVGTEWWTGHVVGGTHKGLFPANYVQLSCTPALYAAPPSLYELPPLETLPSPALYDFPPIQAVSNLYDEPPIQPEHTERFIKLVQELVSTEERYLGDLVLARKLFYLNLVQVVAKESVDAVFLNWEELIDVSKRMLARMKRTEAPGAIFLAEIQSLSAFTKFCSGQGAAFYAIDKLLENPEARQIYGQCCASSYARGMSLNYFLLLPLGRVTRYPLLVEKMLKESDASSTEHQDLDSALQLLRALVAEVNRAVSEVENVSMLCWCQQHIKVPINPPIEFTSNTRFMGPRVFIHSGILYKTRSGRQLVALLFNDFLLLTTADDHIADAEAFKITRASDCRLSLYRQPMMLNNTRMEESKEGEGFIVLRNGEDVVNLRCVSKNSFRLWLNKLQQAIDNCAIAVSESTPKKRDSLDNHPKGRLLVEVKSVQNIMSKSAGPPPHTMRISLGAMVETFDIDALKHNVLHLTTQFVFHDLDAIFSIGLFQKRIFSPDVPILGETTVGLMELVGDSQKHHGPTIRTMHLRRGNTKMSTKSGQESVTVKFVVQMFNI